MLYEFNVAALHKRVIVNIDDYRELYREYPEDIDEVFSGREGLCSFLEREYALNAACLEKFERAGRDFDTEPARKIDARIIATMDFEHYDRTKLDKLGDGAEELILHGIMCSEVFNSLTDQYLDRLQEYLKTVNDGKQECEKASDHLNQCIKKACI